MPFDLSKYVYVMKKFLKKKSTVATIATYPKLTYDGAAAIYMFTCESPLYKELNRRLRQRDRHALKDGFFPYTRLLFEGYRAMTEPKPRMVNRGVKKDLVNADPDSYEVGESVSQCLCSMPVSSTLSACSRVKRRARRLTRAHIFWCLQLTWWAFSSTTANIAALSNDMFLGSDGDRTVFQVCEATCISATQLLHLYRLTQLLVRLLLQIHTNRGVDISKLSAIPTEAEILLPAGTVLKITGVLPKDASGLTIVTLEDDEDAPELID